MRPIAELQRAQMSSDPFYSKCRYPLAHPCSNIIEWHHNAIVAGRQSNVPETILPICTYIHDKARNKEVREVLDLIMLERMTPEEREGFSRAIDYEHRYQYVKNKWQSKRLP